MTPAAALPAPTRDSGPNGLPQIVSLCHLDSLYRIAVCILIDRDAAEACVQNTYVQAHRKPLHPGPDASLRVWLFSLLFEEIRKQRKKWYRFDRRTVVSASSATFTHDDTLAAVIAIPEEPRAAVLLCEVEDFSYEDAARILDLSLSTLVSRLHSGLNLLYTRMGSGSPAERPEFEDALA